ncbi:MAG: TolC family protein [Magnetococcales bacterium]|nr:TolC family protein [Magnetococcales bacterium]
MNLSGLTRKRWSNHWNHSIIFSVAAAGVLFCSGVATAAGQDGDLHPVGASVKEFLELALKMNPERAAASMEAEAAMARAQGAGQFPDPMFQWTLDDISKTNSGLPERVGVMKYSLKQELPWWGKREAERHIAEAEHGEAQGRFADVGAEIALRIKTAYADYHRVHLSMDQTDELIEVMRTLVRFAQFRYAQGMSVQSEITSAEAERGSLDVELVRLGKERHRIRSRLNALVNRQPDAPIVEHPHLRPLPTPEALNYDTLLSIARKNNPVLAMVQSRLTAAVGDQRLADLAWYPDVNLGVGLVQRRDDGEPNGYEAMVEFNLPIQWWKRQARERETAAKTGAMRESLASEQRRIESSLRETLLSLEEAREVERITTDTLMPQGRLALQSALKGYQTGATEAVAVLDTIQRLKKFQIDLLKAQFEGQVRLAEIERLIGGDL